MIELPNGHRFDFVAASGALGYDGRGYWWEKPLWCLGYIRPHAFLVITKTLTRYPRVGNLKWWCPWRCVRPIKNGFVNAVGLTNPGLDAWFKRYYRHLVDDKLPVAVSIAPDTVDEANWMAWRIMASDDWNMIKAIELNVSCPNTERDLDNLPEKTLDMVKAMEPAGVPIIVKLGWSQPYLRICKALDGRVAAFDLINSVPWKYHHEPYAAPPSPLAKYGLEGGISGPKIALYSINALGSVIDAGIKTPIISGGGVWDISGVISRFNRGAGAVSFGTLFLSHPTRPNQLVTEWRTTYEASHAAYQRSGAC